MAERIPISYRLARAALLTVIVVVVALAVLWWASDAVALARDWLTVVDRWSEMPDLW